MADVELLRVGRLCEGAAERVVKEQRIVAEAVRAAGSVYDAAFDGAAVDATHGAALDQRNRTDEARGAVFDAAEIVEQQAVVRLIGGVGAGVARRIDARRA